ncbi:hypothetical protein DM01DRAFT_26244 [Hesseltinella vesiculosa]|uniref:Protection of telomeres protein 1 ssDNA-binding domain-containing protein n=1 Tax=Hesseltinella vesiculosa TaxID=101127 RepID=A0A1X2GIT4_9FUNG|nr:hypothetical protein DM01DRAFT_26244 [Hesseltinella vesiculosa]
MTDFTNNPHPIKELQSRNAEVPYQQCVWVSLYDENKDQCPDLEKYDYLSINNLQCKKHSRNDSLELVCRGDKANNSGFKSIKTTRYRASEPTAHWPNAIQDLNRRRQDHDKKKDPLNMPDKHHSATIAPVYSYISQEKRSMAISPLKEAITGKADREYRVYVNFIDYKQKDLMQCMVRYCNSCASSSPYTSTECRNCKNSIASAEIWYRFTFKFMDTKTGDKLIATNYSRPEQPLFKRIETKL